MAPLPVAVTSEPLMVLKFWPTTASGSVAGVQVKTGHTRKFAA